MQFETVNRTKIGEWADSWAEAKPIRGYVDYREVEVPEIPLLDKIIMGWDWNSKESKKKITKRAINARAQRKHRQSFTPEKIAAENQRKKDWRIRNQEHYDRYLKDRWQSIKADPVRHEYLNAERRKYTAANREEINRKNRESRAKRLGKSTEEVR